MVRMILCEFLKKLAATRESRGWRLVKYSGQLRDRSGCCPIVSLAAPDDTDAAAWMNAEWLKSAKKLGLNFRTARRVVIAADFRNSSEPALRRRLLLAC